MSAEIAPDARAADVAVPGAHVPLAELEVVIERGLHSFVEVGNALLSIKIGKRYRESGYNTFEDYCTRRWNMSRQHGNRLVVAAATAETLARDLETEPRGSVLPTTEKQIRPLTALPSDERPTAWIAAVESADGEQPSATQVARAVAVRTAAGPAADLAASKPRRYPIITTAGYLASDLDKIAKRVERFADDDRINANREQLTIALGVQVVNLETQLARLRDLLRIPPEWTWTDRAALCDQRWAAEEARRVGRS